MMSRTTRTRQAMSDDPWLGIETSQHSLLGRRIAEPHALDVYWVKSAEGAPGLLVRGIDAARIPYQLPRPRGLSVETSAGKEGFEARMFLREAGDRDVFRTLCQDVIAYSASDSSRSLATEGMFRRLEQWHSLLSRGHTATMPPHEVRGLIGELYVLEALIERHGFEAAIRSWVAPEDHPQDFALETRIVEVKARVAGSRQHVQISSLEQLDSAHLQLSLLVVELVNSDSSDAFSLNGICERLSLVARQCGINQEDALQAALLKRGYMRQEAYDFDTYRVVGVAAFDVVEGFPRLTRTQVDLRIPKVQYALDLAQLKNFEVSIETVLD